MFITPSCIFVEILRGLETAVLGMTTVSSLSFVEILRGLETSTASAYCLTSTPFEFVEILRGLETIAVFVVFVVGNFCRNP